MDSKSLNDQDHFVDLESGASESDDAVDSLDNSSSSIETSLMQKLGIESSKEKSRRKPSKPPRPPKSALPVVIDQKLVKEISERAMLKRAKFARMKAFRKKKNGKKSSSNGYLFALVITVLFCIIIVWQGMHF